jgi:hypothetical protein
MWLWLVLDFGLGKSAPVEGVFKKSFESGAPPTRYWKRLNGVFSLPGYFAGAIGLKRGFTSLDSAKEASLPMISDRH